VKGQGCVWGRSLPAAHAHARPTHTPWHRRTPQWRHSSEALRVDHCQHGRAGGARARTAARALGRNAEPGRGTSRSRRAPGARCSSSGSGSRAVGGAATRAQEVERRDVVRAGRQQGPMKSNARISPTYIWVRTSGRRISGSAVDGWYASHGGAKARHKQCEAPTTGHRGQSVQRKPLRCSQIQDTPARPRGSDSPLGV
jgi:hypothetical protein